MPLLKDLYEVSHLHAAHWKEIGILLDLPPGELNIIERDNMYRVEQCCRNMLEKWLEVDPDASWPKFFEVIDRILFDGGNVEGGIATYVANRHVRSFQKSHEIYSYRNDQKLNLKGGGIDSCYKM